MAPSSEYLLRLDQPAMKTESSVAAPMAKKKSRPASMSTSTMLRPMGSTAKPMKTATTSTSGARKCTDRVGAERNDVFLGQRFDAVGDGLEKAEGADAVGAETVLDAAQAFALEDCGEREEAGKDADNGDDAEHDAGGGTQRRGQKADEPMRRRMKIWSRFAKKGVVAIG